MICWNCSEFLSHKKVKWHPRKAGDPFGVSTEVIQEAEKYFGNKKGIATPNRVFGFQEYEYRGQCPECNIELTCFWFGIESMRKNKDKLLHPRSFLCNKCENKIHREFQFLYSNRVVEGEKIKEYLVTICPECHTEQGYPFEYDLEYGIIE